MAKENIIKLHAHFKELQERPSKAFESQYFDLADKVDPIRLNKVKEDAKKNQLELENKFEFLKAEVTNVEKVEKEEKVEPKTKSKEKK